VARDALAHLDGHARDHPHDRRGAVGGAQRGERYAAEDRDDALRAAADLGGDALQPGRLVREQHHVGVLRELGVGCGDVAAELGDERLGARPVGVVHEHGVTPAARERAGHVPRSDEPEPHIHEP
jgi:hypothetical protein